MRLAVVGGGGFRTPIVYQSIARIVDRVPVDGVVLQDPYPHRLARVADVIEGLRHEHGGPPIRTTTSLEAAVDGSDFVFCAIRVGGLAARAVDESVPLARG